MTKLKKFTLDAVSSYINMFMKIAIYFISIPIYLDVYGKELYGVFLLTFGIASSFTFFDFGITNSLIRYASAYKRKKDIELFSKELSFSLSSLFYSIAVVSIIFISLAFSATLLFKIPDEHKRTAFNLFLIAIPFTLSIFTFNFTKFLLNGLGHFFKRNILQTINIGVTLIILFLVFFYKINILYFALLSIIPNLIGITIDIYYLKKYENKLFHQLNLKFNLKWNYVFKSEYSKFNLNIFKNSVIGFFSREIDKPLIAFFLGTNVMVGFSILMQPFSIAKSLIANVFFVIQQKLQQNLDNKNRLKLMVLTFSRSNFILVFFLIIVVYISYPGFVKLWLPNQNLSYESNWAFLVVINLLIMGFYKAQFSLLSLSDENINVVKLSLISVIINVLISAVLIKHIGILSVVIGTMIQALYNFIYFYFYSKNELNISIQEYLNVKYLILSISVFILAFYLRSTLFFYGNTWMEYILKVSFFIVPFVILVLFLFKQELKLIKSL